MALMALLKCMATLAIMAYVPIPIFATTTSARWPYQTYVTEPTFRPPKPVINYTETFQTSSGLIIFSQDGSFAPEAVSLIMAGDGELVWQTDPSLGDIQNLSPFKLFGKDVLISWDGVTDDVTGDSFGTATIWNDNYEPIYNISLSDAQFGHIYGKYDSLLNQHEVYITSRGTFLGLVYDPVPADLSAVGGLKNGWIRDGVVVEIDIKTNKLLFTWRASDYIPVVDSYAPIENARSGFGNSSDSGWDYVHLNAVSELNEGIVVSSRHTFQAIYINRKTGGVNWIVQGEGKNDFTIDEAAIYRWQHDIRIKQTAEGLMMHLHNNQNNYTPPYNLTTANLMRIDEEKRHVYSIQVYQDPNDPLSSSSGGSYQTLENGNVFVCHASQPVIKEYTPEGKLLWSFRYGPAGYATGPGIGSYRAFKYDWKGYPTTKPKAGACVKRNGDLTVFMSWNGATELKAWNVYAGFNKNELKIAARNVVKTGFETKATISRARYLQIEALGGCRSPHTTQRSIVLNITDVGSC